MHYIRIILYKVSNALKTMWREKKPKKKKKKKKFYKGLHYKAKILKNEK
jgi:hypothetical protein